MPATRLQREKMKLKRERAKAKTEDRRIKTTQSRDAMLNARAIRRQPQAIKDEKGLLAAAIPRAPSAQASKPRSALGNQ